MFEELATLDGLAVGATLKDKEGLAVGAELEELEDSGEEEGAALGEMLVDCEGL